MKLKKNRAQKVFTKTPGRDTVDWEAAICDAVRAPSSHNSQPWLFQPVEGGIEVLADFSRRLPVVDPTDRELFISCGAVVEHLCLAVGHQGFATRVQVVDGPGRSVATVRLDGAATQSEKDQALYQAVFTRQTTRQRFEMLPVPKIVETALEEAAVERDAQLHLVKTAEEQRWLSELIMEGDQKQSASPGFRKELAAWLRPNHASANDGIVGSTLGLNDYESYLAPLVVRTFDTGDRQAARDQQLVNASALIAVLCTPLEGKYDWIRCGQALARVSLTAEAAGLTMSYLNQPIEVPELREELQSLLSGNFYPQLVLRFGRAARGSYTPRRPVHEVFLQPDS